MEVAIRPSVKKMSKLIVLESLIPLYQYLELCLAQW